MKKALLEKLRKLGIVMLATACLVTANPVHVNATTETVEDSDSGDDEDEDTKGNQATGSTPQDGQENSGASENVSGEDDEGSIRHVHAGGSSGGYIIGAVTVAEIDHALGTQKGTCHYGGGSAGAAGIIP